MNSSQKTCLLVDDSRVVRRVARRICEELSFACEESGNGQEAWEQCRKNMPDAIILDWNMPVMSGIEFLERLRRMPGGEKPKVIICTTESDLSNIARAIHAGADEYVMKPFDRDIVRMKFFHVGLLKGSH